MEHLETEHYIFHYNTNTKAEQDIAEIASFQENCHRHICSVLKTVPAFKIQYYLCDSPEEVGRLYGDDEPCNGFTSPPDTIYAVYNEQIQCIGFHEDAHIISYTLNRPDAPAIREGLAMFFDRMWWDIPNLDWAIYYRMHGRYIPVDALMDRERFFSTDCAITYPIMGAFTEFLISVYGIDAYLSFYTSTPPAWRTAFSKTIGELNGAFEAYLDQLSLEPRIADQIAQLVGGIASSQERHT